MARIPGALALCLTIIAAAFLDATMISPFAPTEITPFPESVKAPAPVGSRSKMGIFGLTVSVPLCSVTL